MGNEPSTWSLLTLVCPGLGKKWGEGRTIVTKDKDGVEYIDPSAQNLSGCQIDAGTMAKLVQNRKKDYGNRFSVSGRSTCDSYLKKSEAKERFLKWYKEDKSKVKLFYFSGHGTCKNGGGICFHDGTLYYKDLAEMLIECIKDYDYTKTIIIIIDACYSGTIINTFKELNLGNNVGDVTIFIHYSSQSNQVSFDNPQEGGHFTNYLFDQWTQAGKEKDPFSALPEKEWEFEVKVKNGKKKFQKCGFGTISPVGYCRLL